MARSRSQMGPASKFQRVIIKGIRLGVTVSGHCSEPYIARLRLHLAAQARAGPVLRRRRRPADARGVAALRPAGLDACVAPRAQARRLGGRGLRGRALHRPVAERGARCAGDRVSRAGSGSGAGGLRRHGVGAVGFGCGGEEGSRRVEAPRVRRQGGNRRFLAFASASHSMFPLTTSMQMPRRGRIPPASQGQSCDAATASLRCTSSRARPRTACPRGAAAP
jgi:hypothetical protein